MDLRQLGRTDLKVTSICLGTMTWGEQNTEFEAHKQLDYAMDRGINFIDTAEMYPVPGNPKTQGRTESYIGSWIKARGKRVTGVAGKGKFLGWHGVAFLWSLSSGPQMRPRPSHNNFIYGLSQQGERCYRPINARSWGYLVRFS